LFESNGHIAILGDVHTHVWAPEHLSAEFRSDMLRAWPSSAHVDAGYDAHRQHASAARRSVVLAFDAPYCGFVVPDEFVADYVRTDEKRLVGFCSIDPQRGSVEARLDRAVEDLGLKGVKLAPTYQGFDPLSAEAFRMYEAIAARGLPIMWHQGLTFVRRSIMAYALPRHIDDVAIRFPELRIVIAHMGHPWVGECIGVIRKHPNVYADISALTSRPIQFRDALIMAGEYRCGHKLLFGTDWPFDDIERTVNMLTSWSNDETAPAVLRDVSRVILQTDPLSTLGL
jgi:predicted TIM-barrel fold metal-dependent hydrolase